MAQPIFLCYSEISPPVEPLDWLQSQPQERPAYWRQPDFLLAGSGTSALWQDGGWERFPRALAFCESVVDRSAGEVPLMVGGFAFAEQSSHNCLWLPQRLLVQSAGRSRVQIQYAVLPGMDGAGVVMAVQEQMAIAQKQPHFIDSSDREVFELPDSRVDNPQQKTWRETIDRALSAIQEGTLKKVVLARALEVCAKSPWQHWGVLSRLQKQFPNCFNFLLESPDRRLFLGASPERLFQIESGRLTCDAIAGSIERGENPTQDQILADSLWHSDKDRHEHALVVQSICDRLRQCGLAPHPSDHPQLLKLANVQHLYTPIQAQLPQTSLQQVFSLLQSLHPTAAVGGEPRQQALDFLTAWEPRDRGWYAAPVGWLDGSGRATFAVGIRSAYLAGDRAELFAGAGIVAASRPEDETAETLLKFTAMLDALGVSWIP
ncbi:MAG: isochorismate synthase [Oscillatoriales cyanobacterium SM2_2_1]|nr:isochorismate synthase [Oscillatoriales cyanobacterium SM2_2_1]